MSRIDFIGIMQRARFQIQQAAMRANSMLRIRHIHGKRRVKLSDEDVIAVCLVKNGELFVRKFIHHHLELGVKHIVFVDNGSSDDTLAIASSFAEVSIIQSRLPAKKYECLLRRYAVERFAQGHWCLVIDMDEFFDYPHSATVTLKELVRYLNRNSFTAVIGQMLDLFSDKPINHFSSTIQDFETLHCFYDCASIFKCDYHDHKHIEFSYYLNQNTLGNPNIKFHFGGIRKAVFGTNNCLTKHCLIRVHDGLEPVTHPHASSHALCADFTVLLKHYKFAGDFNTEVRRHIVQATWDHSEYEAYLGMLEKNPDLNLLRPTSRKFSDVASLIREGFLVSSPNFDEWASKVTAMTKTNAPESSLPPA